MDLTLCRRALAGAACILLLLLAGAPVGRAATIGSDAIHRKAQGEPIRGVITAETIDGVQFGEKMSIPSVAISQVDYYDTPEAFRRGHDRRQQGIFAEAIKYYETAAKTPNVRKFWIEPACLYYAGLCHLDEGVDMAAAVAKFQELLQGYPNSRYVPDTLLGLGRAHYTARKWEAALAQFKKLAELAAGKTAWEEWLGTAYLWQAKTYLDANKPVEAMANAKKVKDVVQDPKHDIVVQARAVEAKVMLEQDKPKEAVDMLRALIKDLAPRVAEEIDRSDAAARLQRTEAQCYNALGQAYLKLYAKSKKEEDLRESLLAFLWTVVLYPRSQFALEHAEALFHAAQCFEKLKQKARATELLNELSEKYPDSPYNTRTPGTTKAGAPKKGE